MKFKTGDKVKFLNTTGGGVITRIIDKTMVHVMIDEGFDIPVMVRDIIMTGESGDAAANIFTRAREKDDVVSQSAATGVRADMQKNYAPGTYAGKEMAFGVYLAFRPMDQRVLTLGDMEVMLINHTEYPLLCQLYLRRAQELHFKKQFNISKGQSIILEQIAPKEIEAWLSGALQFMVQPMQSENLMIPSHTTFAFKGVKFFREDAYENTSLDPHKLISFLLKPAEKFRAPESKSTMAPDLEAISFRPTKKATPEPFIKRYITSDGYAEVDLHIAALIEDHRSVNPMEALTFQMNHFHKCLNSVLLEKIQKMIVIHGVGNGILKAEILKSVADLNFAQTYDAPIKKYGIGATVIEFHHTKNLSFA